MISIKYLLTLLFFDDDINFYQFFSLQCFELNIYLTKKIILTWLENKLLAAWNKNEPISIFVVVAVLVRLIDKILKLWINYFNGF